MDIHEFLDLPHRFRWGGVGGDDCLTFPASWVEKVTGTDPAEEFRGQYRTREEAYEILDRFGGPVELMGHQLTSISALRVTDPQTGDVGIIRAMTGETVEDQVETMIGAVRFGPLWACIHPAGIRATRAVCLAAWRLPA